MQSGSTTLSNAIATILRAATRKPDEPLNVLVTCIHERTASNLAKTGHHFWLIPTPHLKATWNEAFCPRPANFRWLTLKEDRLQIPSHIRPDLVVAEHKNGAFQMLLPIANYLQVPLLSLEHTMPHPSWPKQALAHFKTLKGHRNFFISEYSRNAWGWSADEAEVIHHGVDTDLFRPGPSTPKTSPHVLSVANDLNDPPRHFCCGWAFWQQVTRGLPARHLGTSKDGFSKPADGPEALAQAYRDCSVFIDTAASSPIPTVVLEALSSGCIVLSRGNAMVPEVIQDGVNGFIREDPQEFRRLLEDILQSPEKYQYVREPARRTIQEKFSLKAFVQNWDRILRETADIPWRGSPC